MTTGDTSTILIVCPHCIADNDESACFCHHCFTPLRAHAEIDPMYRIYAEWNTYRKAIAAPRRLSTVIGIYLLFGPAFMAVALMALWGAVQAVNEPADLFTIYGVPFLLAAIFAAAQLLMYGAILYRVTRNYRHRPADEAEQPDEAGDAAMEGDGVAGEPA